MILNVFSWNVLSNRFFTSKDYPTYNPLYFDSDRKREQVLFQIQKVMKSNTLIALQEVCQHLMPELVKLALNMNYVIRDAYYGNEKSGNMGVVLMWPNNIYKVNKYEQVIVGQHINQEVPQFRQSWWEWFRQIPPPICPIKYAKSRPNVLITVNLIGPTGSFIFAVYHMPCAYWDTRIMQHHLTAIENICSNMIDRDTSHSPLVLCMDMNAKPDSTLYKFLTSKNLISAHKFENDEPVFTINTHSVFSSIPFKGTIDYIWVTADQITDVQTKMPYISDHLLPNDNFPSDHLWTEAQLYFK